MSTAIWCVVLPIVFLGISTIIFSGNIDDELMDANQLKINCPLPIYEGVVQNFTLIGTTLQYTIIHGRDIDGLDTTDPQLMVGTFFRCAEDNTVGASAGTKEYGSTEGFTGFPYGWFVFQADTLTAQFNKAVAQGGIIAILTNATIPVNLVSEVPLLAIPYAILFLVLAIGGYLLAHPLKR